MSQFTGLLSATGLGSIQNLGVEPPDVTPNAVNWTNVNSASPGTTNTQTFTGINTTITLSVSWTNSSCFAAEFYYIKNGGAQVVMTSSPSTVSISNNDTLAFILYDVGGSGCTRNFTVTNTSDNNAVLDTFSMSVIDF